MLFADRIEAGRRLAAELASRGIDGDAIVLGLPRGGVPVAAEVARELGAPLDVVIVRKLGAPVHPEFAIGAIGEDGVLVLDERSVRATGTSADQLDAVERDERKELERRSVQFRGDREPVPVAGRTVVIVDDGIATGSTARAACLVVRERGAKRIVLAVPVAPTDWVESVSGGRAGKESRAAAAGEPGAATSAPIADEFIALKTPEHFMAVGQWYSDFRQTTDDEVVRLLRH